MHKHSHDAALVVNALKRSTLKIIRDFATEYVSKELIDIKKLVTDEQYFDYLKFLVENDEVEQLLIHNYTKKNGEILHFFYYIKSDFFAYFSAIKSIPYTWLKIIE